MHQEDRSILTGARARVFRSGTSSPSSFVPSPLKRPELESLGGKSGERREEQAAGVQRAKASLALVGAYEAVGDVTAATHTAMSILSRAEGEGEDEGGKTSGKGLCDAALRRFTAGRRHYTEGGRNRHPNPHPIRVASESTTMEHGSVDG